MDGETPSGGPTEKNLAVSLHNGGPITVTLEYASGTINLSVIDVATKHRDAVVFHVDLPSLTGPDAFVGFTGGTGGKTSAQGDPGLGFHAGHYVTSRKYVLDAPTGNGWD
jgi:hypothetical protein